MMTLRRVRSVRVSRGAAGGAGRRPGAGAGQARRVGQSGDRVQPRLLLGQGPRLARRRRRAARGPVAGCVLARLRYRRTSTASRSAANGCSGSASTSRRASASATTSAPCPASTRRRSATTAARSSRISSCGSFRSRHHPLPAVGRGGVEPYVGAGIGVFNWRYSEVGEFVDTRRLHLPDRFVGRRHGRRPGRPRRHPLPGRRRVDGRRGGALAEGRRQGPARRGLPRRQDRSRRLDHELHVPLRF